MRVDVAGMAKAQLPFHPCARGLMAALSLCLMLLARISPSSLPENQCEPQGVDRRGTHCLSLMRYWMIYLSPDLSFSTLAEERGARGNSLPWHPFQQKVSLEREEERETATSVPLRWAGKGSDEDWMCQHPP